MAFTTGDTNLVHSVCDVSPLVRARRYMIEEKVRVFMDKSGGDDGTDAAREWLFVSDALYLSRDDWDRQVLWA